MRRARSIVPGLAAGFLFLLLPADAALAGGSNLESDRRSYVPGDTAVARSAFSLRGQLEGRIKDGPYYAYLLPEGKWLGPGHVPAAAILLGPMAIVRDAPAAVTGTLARLDFTVPEVPRGLYTLAYCKIPCTVDGIGDLLGGSFFVAPTRIEGRLLARVQRLAARVRSTRYKVRARIRGRVRQAERQLTEQTDAMQAEIASLESQLARASEPKRAEARSSIDPWAAVVLSVMVSFLVASLLFRRRRRAVAIPAAFSPEPTVEIPRVTEDSLRRC